MSAEVQWRLNRIFFLVFLIFTAVGIARAEDLILVVWNAGFTGYFFHHAIEGFRRWKTEEKARGKKGP